MLLFFEKGAPVNAAGQELWGYRGLLMWESTLRSPFWVSAHHKIHKPLSNFAIRSTMGLLLSKGWDTPFIQVQTQYPLAADDESKRGVLQLLSDILSYISAKLGMDYKGLNRSAKFEMGWVFAALYLFEMAPRSDYTYFKYCFWMDRLKDETMHAISKSLINQTQILILIKCKMKT